MWGWLISTPPPLVGRYAHIGHIPEMHVMTSCACHKAPTRTAPPAKHSTSIVVTMCGGTVDLVWVLPT